MEALEEGGIYMLPLKNKIGVVGELPFRVKKIVARPAPGRGAVGGRVACADRAAFTQSGMGYAIVIEGPVSFGTEENSGCFVTTEYIFAHARAVTDEVQRREVSEVIREWILMERAQ